MGQIHVPQSHERIIMVSIRYMYRSLAKESSWSASDTYTTVLQKRTVGLQQIKVKFQLEWARYMYRSLKKWCAPPTFGPISSKFTQMSAHPRASLRGLSQQKPYTLSTELKLKSRNPIQNPEIHSEIRKSGSHSANIL